MAVPCHFNAGENGAKSVSQQCALCCAAFQQHTDWQRTVDLVGQKDRTAVMLLSLRHLQIPTNAPGPKVFVCTMLSSNLNGDSVDATLLCSSDLA